MDCTYLPEKSTLIANAPMLHITHKGSGNKESVPMARLHKIYPHTNTLNLNPTNMAQNSELVMSMSLERMLGLSAGKNPADLPNPTKYTDDLYLEDLKKMVAFYLNPKNVPNVD